MCGREREGHNSKLVSFGTLIMVWTSSFLVKVAILLIKPQTHGQNSHNHIILGSSTYLSFLLTMAGYQKKHIPKRSKLHHVVDIALIGECTCGIWMTADALCSQWIWVSSALSSMCVCVCVMRVWASLKPTVTRLPQWVRGAGTTHRALEPRPTHTHSNSHVHTDSLTRIRDTYGAIYCGLNCHFVISLFGIIT